MVVTTGSIQAAGLLMHVCEGWRGGDDGVRWQNLLQATAKQYILL